MACAKCIKCARGFSHVTLDLLFAQEIKDEEESGSLNWGDKKKMLKGRNCNLSGRWWQEHWKIHLDRKETDQ